MSTPRKPFVILTMARCGSYFLSSLLDSANDVCCYGEIFKKQKVELPDPDLKCLGLSSSNVQARNQLGEGFLNYVVGLNPRKTTGFKAFLDHFDAAQMHDFPKSTQWRKIFLTRNVVEQYVSLARAQQTGVFTYLEGEDIDRSLLEQKINIDFSDFQDFVEYRKSVDDAFARLQRRLGQDDYVTIDYADLNEPVKVQKLLTFIGSTAQHRDLKSNRLKQFARPFREGVENYEEFESYLSKSGQQNLLPTVYPNLAERLRKIWQRKQAA